ncbi:hypothetical protein NC652_008846 [Populus alba x Populus x berolinensis]|nr:hypothetical protein NC652_008846 [Populus alba x Populus x berolinensis]
MTRLMRGGFVFATSWSHPETSSTAPPCKFYVSSVACAYRNAERLRCNLIPDKIVPASYTVSASGKDSIKLPAGYHGDNAFTSPAALSKAGLPCKDSLEYELELVKEIKNN